MDFLETNVTEEKWKMGKFSQESSFLESIDGLFSMDTACDPENAR